MRTTTPSSTLILGFIFMTLFGHSLGQLEVGFYNGKCGDTDIEDFISNLVKNMYAEDPDTVANLVRFTFHDCFVRGCDASVFLDGDNSEKQAGPNLDLGGFDQIDELKDAVENVCPGVVSCADLLFIASRSAISVAGGNWFEVETGRRDGFVSVESEAAKILPGPEIPITDAISLFESVGLTTDDFVTLLGAHTVGTAHCHSMRTRIYNFSNTGTADPSISAGLLLLLKQTCPFNTTIDDEAFLDQTPSSNFTWDNDFYKDIRAHNAIITIDQRLALDSRTTGEVKSLSCNQTKFFEKFAYSLTKMGRIDVLTGSDGEIRKSCRVTNNSTNTLLKSVVEARATI